MVLDDCLMARRRDDAVALLIKPKDGSKPVKIEMRIVLTINK